MAAAAGCRSGGQSVMNCLEASSACEVVFVSCCIRVVRNVAVSAADLGGRGSSFYRTSRYGEPDRIKASSEQTLLSSDIFKNSGSLWKEFTQRKEVK